MLSGAMQAVCEFSLLVCQQNQSDLSRKALDYALEWFHEKKSAFRAQKILKSAKAKVNDPLARESHQFCKQKIDKISAAMEVLVYRAKNITTA